MFNNTIFLWCTRDRKFPCNIMWFTKFLNAFKIYSLWLSYCNIFSLFLAHVFLEVFYKNVFFFFLVLMIFYNETSLSISWYITINKTKYQTPPCPCVCVGPHTSKWTSPNNIVPMFLYHLEMHIDIAFTSNIQVTSW